MNKEEFLDKLRENLKGIPKEEYEERIDFYREMIDDRMEEGMNEEEAVESLEKPEVIASRIINVTPLHSIVKEKIKPKRPAGLFSVILIILGSPIWLSVLIAVITVILAVYVISWATVVTLWAIEAAFFASAFISVASFVFNMVRGRVLLGFMFFAGGLTLSGLSLFLFFGCREVTRAIIGLTKKIIPLIKRLIIGRRH